MRQDRITSVFLFAIGIFVCIGGYRLGIGTVSAPGSGFMPFLSGILLGCLSSGIFIGSLLKRENISAFGGGWIKGAVVIGSLFLYIFVLEELGFLITTFLFLLLSLLSFKPRKLLSAFVVSLFTVIISYLVLYIWLKVQLPKGILGI